MEINQNEQKDIGLMLIRLGAVCCLGVGLATLGVNANCWFLSSGCGTVGFVGYSFLGLVAVLSGIGLQWSVSSGFKNFFYRLFIGLCMGVSLWGLATLVGSLIG